MPEDTSLVEAGNPKDTTQDPPLDPIEASKDKPWAGIGGIVWDIAAHFHNDIHEVASRAFELRMQWIALKIADETSLGEPEFGNVDKRRRFDPEEIAYLQSIGYHVVGWVYAYGSRPSVSVVAAWIGECRRLGLEGLIIDAEAELRNSGRAIELIDALTANHEGLPLAAALLPIPDYHQSLAFQHWVDVGFDLMFQVYENDFGASWPISKMFDIYAEKGWPAEQIYPMYGAYKGAAYTPDRSNYANFFTQCQLRGYPGSSMWRLDTPDTEAYLGGLDDAHG